ncbi:MAG: EAL domain-containing protein [Sphingomonadales bacterium]|nr:EAL domain-containing protein [Sphingomonadales bacterium]
MGMTETCAGEFGVDPAIGAYARAEIAPLRVRDPAANRRVQAGRIAPGLIEHFLISDSWPMIAPAMAAIYLLTMLVAQALPPRGSVTAAAVSAVLAACAPWFIGRERQAGRARWARYAIMAVAVAGPMLGYGIAVALWQAHSAPGQTELFLGMLLIAGLVAAIALTDRLPALVVAQMSLWVGLALTAGGPVAIGTLVVGTVFALGAALRQSLLDRTIQMRRIEIERKLLRADEILADYEQTGQGWFWETDRRGMLTYVSGTVGRLLEREPGDLIGTPFINLFVLDDSERDGERTLLFHLNARSSFAELVVRAATRNEERWWSISGRPIYDHFNNFLGFRGSGSDLTEKRRSEQHASRLAHYDSLTGLANRFQMSQTLEKILNAPHVEHRACAVLLLDLDRFKQVNDTMGHPAGDALLKQVAQRLQGAVGTLGRVGRLGGDEFQVILPGRIARDKLGLLAVRIIDSLSEPYSIEGSRVVIGASIGVALSPDDGVTSEAIIRNADLALYAAKDRGRGCHHFYDADLHSDAEERRELEHALRDALTHGGLELFYQPIVRTAAEEITGFEALLRWRHPTRGWLSPTKFVPVAEDAGLIAQIGEWALRTACHDLSQWPGNVRVAVNVSPLQFANPALPAIVTSALASAQVAPERLELEITESVFLNDDAGTEAMFAALKGVGVRLALDDFGTGYSSLGYLKKAPFDKIKIDQSFVRGATEAGSRNGAIIGSIVSLANALGMETTAEGVETLDELDLVRELGCSHVQGYIYSKAMSKEQVKQLFAGGNAGDETVEMVAQGPRSARETRRTVLRKVTLRHGEDEYQATIRNISSKGAMLEGLWDVPVGVEFDVLIGEECLVHGVVGWSDHGQMGLEFRERLAFDASGRITLASRQGRTGAREDAVRPADESGARKLAG